MLNTYDDNLSESARQKLYKAEILLFLIPHISLHLHKVEIVNSQIIVRNMHFLYAELGKCFDGRWLFNETSFLESARQKF